MRAESREAKEIPRDRSAQRHFLIPLLFNGTLPSLRSQQISLRVHISTQMSHFMRSVPYPRVSWSHELLLCLGWVRILDLGLSWLLEVLTDRRLPQRTVLRLLANLSDHMALVWCSRDFPFLISV